MDTSNSWSLKDVLQTLFAFGQACSVIAAIFIYRHQSRKISASEKQANRARLTEAYMNWHHTILGNDENTKLSGKMMRRGHALEKDHSVDISQERAREIHMLCLLLNTLFLECNYRNTYDRKPIGLYKKLRDFLKTGKWPEYDKNTPVEFPVFLV